MGEVVTDELLAKQMQAGFAEIKTEIAAVRAEQALTSRKIGALAEGMVSVNKRLDDFGRKCT